MEHWPGHDTKSKVQTDKSKDKGKQKEQRVEPSFWQWPHLVYGSIGRTTLVSKDGRVHWSSVVDTSRGTKSLPLYKPVKVFPETRSPPVDTREHSARKRVKKGLQYLRTYFPDADFPSELLGSVLEGDTGETCRPGAFDPFLGNLLEIIPSHQTQNEFTVVFPMGKLGGELNISRFVLDSSGNMVFNPTGSPSFSFGTPILQISSTVVPSEWLATPYCNLLIRAHTSSSLFRLERSKISKELDITRSDAGDIPIVDSRILASGPDIVVVNRKGNLYRCNTCHSGKAMESIGAHEVNSEDDFWQLGITRRTDECFLASCKAVKHIDLRAAKTSFVDIFSLDHPSAVVTSFQSPIHDHIGHITTTSEVIWLDDRFRRRPLLSYKHYRSFDRTLRMLSADLGGALCSLLTSRRNSLVTLYDASRGPDGLFHCNSSPSCLPHDPSMFTTFGGDALVAAPSDRELTFLRLSRQGSIYRQDIRIGQRGEAPPTGTQEKGVTHQWDEDVETLAKLADELQIDFGPAGGRHYTQVNLRGAYETIFAVTDDAKEDMDRTVFEDALAQLPEVWKNVEETAESMLTTFDVISGIEDGNKRASEANFLCDSGFSSKQVFDTLTCGRHLLVQDLGGLARWHYSIQDTSIPTLSCISVDQEYLNTVSGVERNDLSVRRQKEARESLLVDLALSNDVYTPRQITIPSSFAAGEAMQNTAISSEEPPEVKFGYFRPVRKAGADYYADKENDGEEDTAVSSSLGVRLLLAEWEVGTDPKDYTYCDPYGLVDTHAQPTPPQRKKFPAAPPMTQKKQLQSQQPPAVVAAATQPPVAHVFELAAVQDTHSQQFEPRWDVFSQEPVASTQVLPGPFGGRPGAGKKAGKKRIGGF